MLNLHIFDGNESCTNGRISCQSHLLEEVVALLRPRFTAHVGNTPCGVPSNPLHAQACSSSAKTRKIGNSLHHAVAGINKNTQKRKINRPHMIFNILGPPCISTTQCAYDSSSVPSYCSYLRRLRRRRRRRLLLLLPPPPSSSSSQQLSVHILLRLLPPPPSSSE